jgi:hypothetical protein
MGRVLRPGGLLILKIHHPRFYFRRIWLHLKEGQLRAAALLARVLLAGTVYHLTGRQPNNRILGRETYQTRWLLNRLLSRMGLVIRSELQDSDSNPRTPVFLIEKIGAYGASIPNLVPVETLSKTSAPSRAPNTNLVPVETLSKTLSDNSSLSGAPNTNLVPETARN